MREARTEEYGAVAEICLAGYQSLWASHHGREVSAAYQAKLADVARRAAHGPVLIALLDGEPAGSASLTFEQWEDAEMWRAGDAEVRMLAVEPRLQGRGVARALVERAMELTAAAGLERLTLHTLPFMTAARALYDSLGFEREPEGDLPLGDNVLEALAREVTSP